MTLQLDVQADGTNYNNVNAPGRASEHSFLIGGHWSWRDPRYLWGLFGAAGDATGQDIGCCNNTSSYRHGIIGGEAQAYLGNFTLYGQIGYDTTIGSPVGNGIDNTDAVFGRGTVRYYLTPNTRLEGTGLYAGGRQSFTGVGAPSRDFNIWLARAKLEHKFAGSPFSAFVAYDWSEFRWDTNANFRTVTKFENQKGRMANSAELYDIISAWVAGYDFADIWEVLKGTSIPAGPVNTIPDILEDPHVRKRGSIVSIRNAMGQEFTLPSATPRMSGNDPAPRWTGEALGASTRHVYSQVLGLSDNEMDGLRERGII